MSHDLRTPLTSLRLLAEAIGDGVLDGRRGADYAGAACRSTSTRWRQLIDDLFELSRLEAGDLRWSMQHVALDELVDETVEVLRPQADARGVAVQATVVEARAVARAIPERLQRVLFNLIQNAIRHTPADGTVTVLVGASGSAATIEFEVADTGEGLEPADRERVFEPFYRGDSARPAPGDGAGLGLADLPRDRRGARRPYLARRASGGSAPGTRVRFTLPRA